MHVNAAPLASSDPERWVDDHGDYLYRYALMRLRNPETAEEAVQETFVAALQARKGFAGQSSERTWLVGILKHKIIDHFRRVSKQRPLDLVETLPYESEPLFRDSGEWVDHWTDDNGPIEWGANQHQLFENDEFWSVFDDCLKELPPRVAAVFVLREMEEMSTEEICKVLEITPTNLWVILHRARMQLRRSLEVKWFRRKKDGK